MNLTKTKSLSRMLSLCLALCTVCSMAVTANAASITASGSSGSTPVNLTTTNDGLGGGDDNSPTKLNVTVPTALPMAMADDGTVVTASDCAIVNHSYGAVRVKSVTISAAPDWHLTAFGNKSSLAGEKVDSNQLGFAMTVGEGSQVKTLTKESTQKLISAPVAGCYMTGAGNPDANTAAIAYSAIVTPLSGAVKNTTIANVVFVVEWDTAVRPIS